MKAKRTIKSTLFTGLLAVSIATLYYSCKKENQAPASSSTSVSQKQMVNNAQDLADKISSIKIVNKGKVVGSISTQSGGFSFADPHEGFSFSSSSGVQYVSDPNGGGSLYISASAFGGNAAAGSVQAGNTNMDINYTLCISAADSGSGFSFGPAFSGTSTILGISGDFSKILDGTANDSDMTTIFNGFAMYQVFSDQASGAYPIVNWLQDISQIDENPDAFENKGFAWIMDFRDFHMFFSKSGNLNVSGGSITFDGKYYEFIPEEGAENPFDLGEDPEVNEVDGLGTMGCN